MDDRDLVGWGLEDLSAIEEKRLEPVNNHGWEFLQDEDKAIGPYFTNDLRMRVKQKKACNVLFVGEAGIWKSYCAAQVARHIYPRFCIDQVVYRYSQYYDVLMSRRFRAGAPIMMDEPQDAVDHRDWYKEAQQAIVKTITSQRFMVKPLFIPIISANLLDKTIRDYLVQYQVECTDRGYARVFRLSPSMKEDKTYYYHRCDLQYGLMDNDVCAKDSCLGCGKQSTCTLFRAQYERKKKEAQYEKYKQKKRDALLKESQHLTLDQITEKVYPHRKFYTDDNGKINVKKMRMILREAEDILIGHNKAYDIRTLLEYRYPRDFVGHT